MSIGAGYVFALFGCGFFVKSPRFFWRIVMNRSWILLLVAAFPAMLLAQNYSQEPPAAPYQPAVPPPSNINSYGGYYSSGGGTAAGSAMNGMSNVISAKGNYNLSTSAAAINMTQAEKNSLQNAQLRTDTYFQMRTTNTAARKAEAGPRRRWSRSRVSPARAAPPAGHREGSESDFRSNQLAGRVHAGRFHPAARGIGADHGETSEVRGFELIGPDASPQDHRKHVRWAEVADRLDSAARITPTAGVS